jgi:hypothetical protein
MKYEIYRNIFYAFQSALDKMRRAEVRHMHKYVCLVNVHLGLRREPSAWLF